MPINWGNINQDPSQIAPPDPWAQNAANVLNSPTSPVIAPAYTAAQIANQAWADMQAQKAEQKGSNPNSVWQGRTQAGQAYVDPGARQGAGTYGQGGIASPPPPNTPVGPKFNTEGSFFPTGTGAQGTQMDFGRGISGFFNALGGLLGSLGNSPESADQRLRAQNLGVYPPSAFGSPAQSPDPGFLARRANNPPSTAPILPGEPNLSSGYQTPKIQPPLGTEPAPGAQSVTPPTESGAPGGSKFPTGAGVTYDDASKTYTLADGKQIPETGLGIQLDSLGTKYGITGAQFWNAMVNNYGSRGGVINSTYLDDVHAQNAAAAIKADPTMGQPKAGGTSAPTGSKTDQQIQDQANSKATEAGAANNQYFRQIVFDQPQAADSYATYAAAVRGGFTGNFTSWLVTKDAILAKNRSGSSYSSGGEVAAPAPAPAIPPQTPGGITEPSVRPFGSGREVQLDPTDLQTLENVSTSYPGMFQSLMKALGYTSTGFMGQYGQMSYLTPQNPIPLTDTILSQITTDPTAQAWLKWLAYRKGIYGGISQFPVVPQ